MAQSPNYSPSPSPGLHSSNVSDSSSDEGMSAVDASGAPSTSRPSTPAQVQTEAQQTQESMECQWEDCGRMFNNLAVMIEHIHNDHIGVHKSNYTCEWKTCPRRGVAQTSRFALISHIRSHTGEKPFICTLPECDKSFTRSDALAKHMRMQHNIIPPAPGRGGNRKRKREDAEVGPTTITQEGYGSFKVEPNPDPHMFEDRLSPALDHELQLLNSAHAAHAHGAFATSPEDGEESDESDDGIPKHLIALQDQKTGLILGRTPAMVKYVIMKAKHQHALAEHASLLEELRAVRREELIWREKKDALLDEVLRATFGAQAEELTMSHPLVLPQPEVQRLNSEE